MSTPPTIRHTGERVRRLEDPRLLRGRGRFVDDLGFPRMLSLAFVRSPYAHARVRAIDATAARALDGVVAVLTAADLGDTVKPIAPRLEGGGFTPTAWHALTDGTARFAGEPVAAVVASSPAVAADAAELVAVDYEPLPAVATVEAGLDAGAVLFRREYRHGDVDGAFARAPVVVREVFTHARCAPSPLEPRGLIADWDGETLTVWAGTQAPQILRAGLAGALGLPESRVRVVVPDTGGGFGLKMLVMPEDVVVTAAARLLGRPVKWMETRREHLTAASQARGGRTEAEVAADAEGRLLALRARVASDAGAYHGYPLTQALEPLGTASILPGPYRTSAYAYESLAVATHKPPLGAYRGVGMTMGAFVMERLLDLTAARLGLDPAEIRRRNLIPRDAYPFTSASGMTYDSGDFPETLARALALAGYDELRAEQRAARRDGRRLGIGVACYTEYTGMGADVFRRRGMVDVPGPEAATVTLEPDGTARVAVSFPAQGQGHATAIAQVVADRLGLPLEHVRLQSVDTHASPAGSGTFGSRGTVAIAGAVDVAAERVGEKVRTLAGFLLEASPRDVVLESGSAFVRGLRDRALTLGEISKVAHSSRREGMPGDLAPGLSEQVHFNPPGATFSGAVHVAVVEVDPETGLVAVRKYVVVEDCGPVINPTLVEGQIHGAVAQGIGEALLEGVVHDAEGQLLTATFMDYALPKADALPAFEVGHLETPSPHMPGGFKGMGEGGTIGAPAAIANAVADALGGEDGARITALPIQLRTAGG